MLHARRSTTAASAPSASNVASAQRANPRGASAYGEGATMVLPRTTQRSTSLPSRAERDRVLLAVEQPERHLGVVLAGGRSALADRVPRARWRGPPGRVGGCSAAPTSVHSVTARQRSDSGMPASARSGCAAASRHVDHGARTDALATDTTFARRGAGHGEVVLVVLEPALDDAGCTRGHHADATAVAAVREVGRSVGRRARCSRVSRGLSLLLADRFGHNAPVACELGHGGEHRHEHAHHVVRRKKNVPSQRRTRARGGCGSSPGSSGCCSVSSCCRCGPSRSPCA